MAIESTRDLCLSVADAIREKKGSSELINPQDFAKEIASIEGGGSGGGGGSTIEYISVEGKNISEWGEAFAITTFLVKMQTQIVTTSFLIAGMGETVDGAIAFAIDPTAEIDFEGTRRTIADFLVNVAGVNLSTYNRITKEQFYDLNA